MINTSIKHVGIIMDGNGRWARKRGLPRPMGHKQGSTSTRNIIDASIRLGLSHLTLYVFSAENWNRPPKEVKLLMKLLVEMVKREIANLQERNVCVKILGDISQLPDDARESIEGAVATTSANTGLVLQLALSYGGRAEIVQAAQKFAQDCVNGSSIETLTEEKFAQLLYNPESPDPELIIRTGGDQRISNFLLWQSAYSELFFTETLWPDFNEDGLLEAVEEFSNRERRFGKVLSE
jgi:undecaprenyl diphosphate synthase